ncbi:hypothetical protein D3C78_1538730 [compost metagenome]
MHRLARLHGGGADQSIDPAELRLDLTQRPGHTGPIRDVEMAVVDSRLGRHECARGRVVEITDHHARPGIGACPRQCGANAVRSAGYDDHVTARIELRLHAGTSIEGTLDSP